MASKYSSITKLCKTASRIVLSMSILCGISFCATLQSCSDEVQIKEENNGFNPEKSELYLRLYVTTPAQNGSRSSTQDGGASEDIVPATEAESTLKNGTIYFAVEDVVKFSFPITHVLPLTSNETGKTHELIIKVNENISQFVALAGVAEVQIFFVGNDGNLFKPTEIGDNKDLKEAKFAIDSAEASVIGDFGTDGHLMPLVTAEEFTVDFSGVTGDDPDAILAALVSKIFKKESASIHWWNIEKTMNLERAVARLEFRDLPRNSSLYPGNENLELPAYTYMVPNTNGLQIELYSMQPYNINTSSYLFRQTLEGDLTKATTATRVLLGKEKNDGVNKPEGEYNWVANPDWTVTSSSAGTTKSFANRLDITETSYNITDTKGIMLVSTIEDRRSKKGLSDDAAKFLPWYYVTENTIPSIELMKDVDANNPKIPVLAKYATGVAFNFIVLGTDGKYLEYESTTPAEGSKYPQGVENDTEAASSEGIIITDTSGKWVKVEPTTITVNNVKKKVYMLRYIASIVHNEGTSTGELAPMYYGVVRNNTYQMTITGINGLPQPQDPRSLWIQLQIQVKPWTVRYNEIEF